MTVVYIVGIFGAIGLASEALKHRERMARARADLELARNRSDVYTLPVVQTAITGALVTVHGVELEEAKGIASVICTELKDGQVYDGVVFRPIDEIDRVVS